MEALNHLQAVEEEVAGLCECLGDGVEQAVATAVGIFVCREASRGGREAQSDADWGNAMQCKALLETK